MNILFLIGRILFGFFFLHSAWSHFKNGKNMTAYAKSKGVPSADLAVLITGCLFLIGGLSVILGVHPDLGLGALIIALVPITFMMHSFWKGGDAAAKNMERIQFMKNTAIIGACLMLLMLPMPWAYTL